MLSIALAQEAHHEINGLLDFIPGIHDIWQNFGSYGLTLLNQEPASFNHVITTLIGTVVVVVFGLMSWKKFKPTPDAKLTPRTVFEMVIDMLRDLLEGQFKTKAEARKYLPLVFGLAVFIFVNNIFALIPGFEPPTSFINTNIGIALIAWLVSVGAALKAKGLWHFLKEMWGPIPWIGWLMFPIELIGQIVRPCTLTIRLMGNMYGDHAIVAILLCLCAPAVPAIMMTLGVLVVIIQTAVFCILTSVYISMAVAEEH